MPHYPRLMREFDNRPLARAIPARVPAPVRGANRHDSCNRRPLVRDHGDVFYAPPPVVPHPVAAALAAAPSVATAAAPAPAPPAFGAIAPATPALVAPAPAPPTVATLDPAAAPFAPPAAPTAAPPAASIAPPRGLYGTNCGAPTVPRPLYGPTSVMRSNPTRPGCVHDPEAPGVAAQRHASRSLRTIPNRRTIYDPSSAAPARGVPYRLVGGECNILSPDTVSG